VDKNPGSVRAYEVQCVPRLMLFKMEIDCGANHENLPKVTMSYFILIPVDNKINLLTSGGFRKGTNTNQRNPENGVF
jgi:hypothetical protein